TFNTPVITETTSYYAESGYLIPNTTGQIGTGSLTTGSTAGNPYYNYFGGYKTQYIYKASELTTAGLSAGNITSVGFDITATGAISYTNFSIYIGTTAQNTATTTHIG